MSELAYTPLSDGFKVAKNDEGNIVFARNDTTLFVADPTELGAALSPLMAVAQPVADTEALTAANATIALQAKTIGDLQDQVAADKSAAVDIQASIANAIKLADLAQTQLGAQQQGNAQALPAAVSGAAEAPAATPPAPAVEAPTIAPSNTGISGS